MASANITIRAVQALASGEVVWDGGHKEAVRGFGVRRQRDQATYVLKYRVFGRQRFFTIGPHGSPWTPQKARREAKRLLGLVADGKDHPVAKAVVDLARFVLHQHAALHEQFTALGRVSQGLFQVVPARWGEAQVEVPRDVTGQAPPLQVLHRPRRGRDDRDRGPRRDGPPKEAAASEEQPAEKPAEAEAQSEGEEA